MTSFTALRHDARGFTLIELLIAVVVVGILAAVAYPSFMDSIRKGRRSDAMQALNAVQQAQERWRGTHAEYAGALANTAAPGQPPNGLGLSDQSPNQYYQLALTGASATGYTVTASARDGKSQASDGVCKVLAIQMDRGNLGYGSGASTASLDWSTSSTCWAR
jgi:type IV pilus assembly protein PilE